MMKRGIKSSEQCPLKKPEFSYGEYIGEVCCITADFCDEEDFPESCPIKQGGIELYLVED